MATIFLRSTNGNDSNDGLSWATAKSTLNNAALAAFEPNDGGTIYVSKNHIESTGSTLALCQGAGHPYDHLKVICVDDTSNPTHPTGLATGAIIETIGTSHLFLANNSYVYYNGITFIAGSGSSSTVNIYKSSGLGFNVVKLENCLCYMASDGSSSRIGPLSAGGTRATELEFINTQVKFTNVGQCVGVRGLFIWRDTNNPVLGPIIPNSLIQPVVGGVYEKNILSNLDLSTISGVLVSNFSASTNWETNFINCKFANNVNITSGTMVSGNAQVVTCINCDSSGVNYQYYTKKYQGEIFDDDSVVAVDGSTIARKMISSTGVSLYNTLQCDPLVVYNTLTGYPLNAAVEIINSGVTLRNDEIWLEVEYPSSSTHTLYARASDGKTHILATSGNQTLSTTAWLNTGGFSSPIRQTLDVDFTPMMSGLIYCTVKLARPATTVYYDRKLRLSVI